jgi:NTP pyrophosphatase (non-canonical NTP hydrolase)
MNFTDYQQSARRTVRRDVDDNMLNAVLGLCGETGEIADELKKARFQGHAFDYDKMVKEAGDVLWYLSLLCDELEVSLEEVAQKNVAKLEKRYKDGFTVFESVERVE